MKVKIKINHPTKEGKTLKLTEAQARKLYEELKEFFHDPRDGNPYPLPTLPIVPMPEIPDHWGLWKKVTCDGKTN